MAVVADEQAGGALGQEFSLERFLALDVQMVGLVLSRFGAAPLIA